MTSRVGVFPKNLAGRAKKANMPKSNVSLEKTDELIELVRSHPVLYNPRLPKHKDAQLFHNTWKSVAELLRVEKFGGK